MLQWLDKLIDRACVVIGALLFLQAPLFMQQYQQEIRGRVTELQFQVGSITQAAAQSGKTLEQYIQKFQQSHDEDFSNQGNLMAAMLERLHLFSETLLHLSQASVFTRPFVFMTYLNYDSARATLHHFNMGIALNYEGVVYALMGMLFGYFFYQGISGVVRYICRFFWHSSKQGST